MNTYSHFFITAALREPIQKRVDAKKLPELHTGAVLFGSFLPDLFLIIVGIIFGIIDVSRGVNLDPSSAELDNSLLWNLFNNWFFNNPWVMAGQNMFHSPLLVAIFIALAYFLWRKHVKGAGWFFWLLCSAMLHTLIDIPLHYDDGPLLLFPFNWDLRFMSPVSYWDPERYGIPFAIFEHSLDLVLIVFLSIRYWPKRWRRKAKAVSSD